MTAANRHAVYGYGIEAVFKIEKDIAVDASAR